MRFYNLALLAPLSLIACGQPVNPPPADMTTGDLACDTTGYPCGPFGTDIDTVIADVELNGRRDDNNSGVPTDDPVRVYHMHDYYRDKNIKALAIIISTESCVPCRDEQPDTIQLFNDYKAVNAGVAMVEAIIQDTMGNPADIATVDRWANTAWGMPVVKIPFDMVNDPVLALQPYYNASIFPTQLVIETEGMTIRWQHTGAITKAELKTEIDAALQ